MILEIRIPSPGESITEVELASWFLEDGALVQKNQEVGEIESEKATLPLIAEKAGQLKILVQAGETVEVGTVVASIDSLVEVTEAESAQAPTPEPDPAPQAPQAQAKPQSETIQTETIRTTPVARKIMEEENLSVDDIVNGLRKITASDVRKVVQTGPLPGSQPVIQEKSRAEERKKMSQLRKKISQRLVAVKNETAMLTTFNEVDMSAVMELRKRHQERFTEQHGIKLGFMSFFTMAVSRALKNFPAVNSRIEEEEVISPEYCDIGIAVQTDKGLMVPVLRNAESLSLAEIERDIADLAARARKARLGIEEMSGGTFTISNGGIYGSMLSTPILNPPQSGILGMHNIVERPVAIKGKVEIRPMMYLALSYDHRVIDGKDSVGFLLSLKNYLENPATMLYQQGSAEEMLLGI